MSGSRGFILAHLMGPGGYGVLGPLVAVQQMMSYAALGMREGVLIQLSKGGDRADAQVVYSSSLVFAGAVGLLLPLVTSSYAIAVGRGFDLNYLLISLIGAASVVNEVLININRHEGNLGRVSFCESLYNIVILALIFSLHSIIDVPLALLCMLGGVAASLTVYLVKLRGFSFAKFSASMTRQLIGLGFWSSILSALFIVVNVLFVLVAHRHVSAAEVGYFVFANNIATVILVSLNAFSWAMTSRSLRALARDDAEARANDVTRTDLFLRIGIVGALLGAQAATLVLPWVTPTYAGSSKYIVLLVGMQCFQLLLFTEVNYLMLQRKVPALIAIFGAANLLNLALAEFSGRPFETIILLAIGCIAIAAACVIAYARSLGLRSVALREKAGGILMILFAVGCSYSLNVPVALVCIGVLTLWMIYRHRLQIRAVLVPVSP